MTELTRLFDALSVLVDRKAIPSWPKTSNPSFEGSIPDRYRERPERLQAIVKLTPWPRNVLRHSFGSYHLAFHKNEALTAAEMGNSPAVIFHHHRALVTPEAAEKYWKLIPETESDGENVVEFAA